MTAASPVVEVSALTYDYPGQRALDDVSFAIAPGTITALIGPNGAGKTTLMRCLAALESPYSGRVAVAGVDTRRDPRGVHRAVGYLADEFGLYDALTVRQCLLHAGAMRGFGPRRTEAAIGPAVQRLGIADRLETRAGELSRGLRQRLAIAQAILHEPRVLVLDEPASGLDPEARRALSTLLKALRDAGMTIFVSSHILAELEDYSTHMLILRSGKLLSFQPIAGRAPDAARRLAITLAAPDARLAPVLAGQPEVGDVVVLRPDVEASFAFAGDASAQAGLLRALVLNGFPVARFELQREAMQDAYLARMAKPEGGRSGIAAAERAP